MQLYKYYSYYNNYVRKRMFGNRCNFVIYVFLLFSSFGESYLYPYNKMLRKPLLSKCVKAIMVGQASFIIGVIYC